MKMYHISKQHIPFTNENTR